MYEIPNRTFNFTGFSLDRAPAEVVAFLKLFQTVDQPLAGYHHKAENCIIASYGPEENRREVQVVASVKIPFDIERHPLDEPGAQLVAVKEAHSKWISERGGIGMTMFDHSADREKAFAEADRKLVDAIAKAFLAS